MQNSRLSIVVSAPSGAGKSTIIRLLLKLETGLEFSISTTTRVPRPDETEGVDYHFVSEESFEDMKKSDEFLEWAVVHRNKYATSKKEVDRIHRMGKIPIFDVDVQGARGLKERLEGGVFVFVIPPSPSVLQKRLRDRNTETEDTLRVRMHTMVAELQEYGNFDYIVVNDDVERAVNDFRAIIQAEQCRMRRMEPFIREWEVARDNSFGKADSV
jgi:guanylate kinase